MANSALGVPPDDSGVGATPLAHRQCIRAHWENTGVVFGLSVTGRSDLSYNVSAGVAVCSRGDSDGYTEAYWMGGQTPVVSAGGASPRIDAVWVRANDVTQGDGTNLVQVGVTSGTPSASPAKPTVPAGCTVIAYMQVPASMSATTGAVLSENGSLAKLRGLGGSRLAYGKVTAVYTVQEDKAWHEQVRVSFAVPTKRIVNIRWKAVSTVDSPGTGDLNERMGSYFMQFRLDGKVINDTKQGTDWIADMFCDEVASTRYHETKIIDYDAEVEAGAHQVSVWVSGNTSPLTYPVRMLNRILEVVDRGAA